MQYLNLLSYTYFQVLQYNNNNLNQENVLKFFLRCGLALTNSYKMYFRFIGFFKDSSAQSYALEIQNCLKGD